MAVWAPKVGGIALYLELQQKGVNGGKTSYFQLDSLGGMIGGGTGILPVFEQTTGPRFPKSWIAS